MMELWSLDLLVLDLRIILVLLSIDSGHEPQGLVGYVGTGPGFTRPGEFLGTINYGNRFLVLTI